MGKIKLNKKSCLYAAWIPKRLLFYDAELEPDPVTLLGVTWEDVKLRLENVVSKM